MNEVRPIGSAMPVPAVPASSQGTVEAQKAAGKQLPSAVEKASKPEESTLITETQNAVKVDDSRLEEAVTSINEYVQTVQRDIQFSVDEDLDTTVVKVVDSDSGELIRQIPGEVFLELARKLNEDGELRLVDATG